MNWLNPVLNRYRIARSIQRFVTITLLIIYCQYAYAYDPIISLLESAGQPQQSVSKAKTSVKRDHVPKRILPFTINTPASNDTITCGDQIQGTLDENDPDLFGNGTYTDLYTFSLTQFALVELSLTTDRFTPYLWIGRVGESTSVFEGYSPQYKILEPGDYLVIANNESPLPAGSYGYTLTLRCTSVQPIEFGQTIQDTIDNNDYDLGDGRRYDAYSVSTESNMSVNINMTSGSITPYLIVLNIRTYELIFEGPTPQTGVLFPGDYLILATSQNAPPDSQLLEGIPYEITLSKTYQRELLVPLQVYGEGRCSAIACSPMGRVILSGSVSGWGILWNVETGTIVRRFIGHKQSISSAVFSPNGTQVLTGSLDTTARLWDTETGGLIRIFSGHTGEINATVFSPNGSQALTGSSDGTAILWNINTGEKIHTLTGHSDIIYSAAFSPDGAMALTGSADRTAILWDVETGAKLYTFPEHADEVWHVEFSRDGSRILTGNLEADPSDPNRTTTTIWDAKTGAKIHSLSIPYIWAWALAPDGEKVVTGSADGTAQLWDAETGDRILTFTGHTEKVDRVTYSTDGRYIVTGSLDDTIKLWDGETGNEISTFYGHTDIVNSVAFSPDGSKVLTGYFNNNTAKMWDTETGVELQTFAGHTGFVNSAAFSPDGQYVLTGSSDTTAKLWNAETSELIYTLTGHSAIINAVAFSPDGSMFATASDDQTVRLWNTSTGKEIHIFTGHTGYIMSVAFSPDGKQLVSGAWDGTARLWNVDTGNEIRSFIGHRDFINSVAFSPDGRQILTGSMDLTAKLWNAGTGDVILTLAGHFGFVNSVTFSPDGKIALTGSNDETAKLWDLETGSEILTITGHTRTVNAVAFSPDGRRVLLGGRDGSASLWELDAPRVIIVAGRNNDPNDVLVESTQALAEYAYSICLARGYEKEDIHWLSSFPNEQDADGDGVNDIYDLATKDNLYEALTQWGAGDLISPGRRLLLYSIDHGYPIENEMGEPDVYFRVNERETVSSKELDSWLDALNTDDLHIDVTLVVESCYSGGFVNNCLPPPGHKRLVISSAGADTEALIMPPPDLTSFSYLFWGAAYMGATIRDAAGVADGFFDTFTISHQHPQMDDTGDGLYTEDDGKAMGKNHFGRSWAYAGHGTGEFPAFASVSPPETPFTTILPGESIELTAFIVPGSEPLHVWAVARPPAPPVIAGIPISASESLRHINLIQDTNDPSRWSAVLDGLDEEGLYLVSFTAQFPYNRLSRAEVTRFQVSAESNPEETLDVRALLAAGSGEQRAFAQEMVTYAVKVCQKRGYKDTSIRALGRDFPTTEQTFFDSLNEFAAPSSTGQKLRLFIYLTGDCTPDGAFELGAGESVLASTLMTRLNELQAGYPELEILLVVDTPYAGVFVEANAGTPEGRRVTIAGTAADGQGVFGAGGADISFSRYFLGNAYQGKDVWSSFEGAYYLLVDHIGAPEPALDDNGDGARTKQDKKLARAWYLGRRGALAGGDAAALPTILEVKAFDEPLSVDFVIWAELLEAAVPDRVWVTILPRNPEELGTQETIEIDLFRNGTNWNWMGFIPLSSFSKSGDYTLTYYASYSSARLSEPLIQTVTILKSNVPVHTWQWY